MNMALGFVSGQTVQTKWMGSVLQLVQQRGTPVISVISGPFLAKSRNRVVELFLTGEWEYLLMTDTDIIFTLGDVDKLASHDCPVTSGLYVIDTGQIAAGYEAEGDKFWTFNYIPEEPVVIDYCGAGFMLVHREAFEAVQKEYGNHWFDYMPTEGTQAGEDISFCKRLKAVEMPILLDPAVRLGHVKTVPLNPENFYGPGPEEVPAQKS
jgi:hypothetical protein